MAAIVSPDREAEVINEFSEPDDFWAGLGGQGEYSQSAKTSMDKPILEARLFHCTISTASGKMRATEISNFEQEVNYLYLLPFT